MLTYFNEIRSGKALASDLNRALEKHGVNIRVLQLVSSTSTYANLLCNDACC